MNRLKDKVAIVTGSTAGIGRGIALAFAEEGAKVVVSGRNAERGDQVVKEIEEIGGEAVFIPSDLLDEPSLKNLVEESVKHFGKLDIVVNNAGKGYSKFLPYITSEEWDEVLKADLKATFLMMQNAMPYLEETKGNVVNIASGVFYRPQTGGHAYTASKAGVVLLSKTTAKEYAPKGVRVNAILPGVVRTDILKEYPEEEVKALEKATPLGRIGEPRDIAMMAVYLASEEASFVTGQDFVCDGGVTI